ncbi:hypothetical protein VTK73DRAFT_4320 [Phialemonium thermophilum]|uniref:Inosine/uridine-preferring nucleoside hydrolase domain-containing protein n=1 Tax=Phialemonium thermophilum TaxID=223376 RepID=A0ABR3WUA4_9PEZI
MPPSLTAGPSSWVKDAWDPVALYRKSLAEADDASVTIASIGFLENLSALLNSTQDAFSDLDGRALVSRKVAELVVMGGDYPSGYEYNFWGSNASLAAHVVNGWPGPIVFAGSDLGRHVSSGGPLMDEGPADDPVRAAYVYYTYYKPRASWDPLAVYYAMHGCGRLFAFGNEYGYNHVAANGSNAWVYDRARTDQHWLALRVDNATASAEVDRLLLEGARHPRGNRFHEHVEL